MYQAKAIKSTGTKYTMTIGDSFSLPIVSLIKCKENKPELFRFKKVYAKDETVELKTDRARFTKDDEQRDLDNADIVDAYRYGSTYVPIDDAESLRLQVTKSFNLIGFTRSESIKRHYFIGDSVNQIMPDIAGGREVEEAFVSMVKSMKESGVCGIVRRVYSTRSSPELACLIPEISDDPTPVYYLYYVSLPFDDDVRKFTLENFNLDKKSKPSDKQLQLVDDLIDSMDLCKENEDGDENEELYDPHTTFNPYIQRMFQSIAQRATNPSAELPDFEQHITSTHLARIGEKVRNETTLNLLKRCAEEFTLKPLEVKKSKNEESLFEKKDEKKDDNEENAELKANDEKNFDMDELLSSKSNVSRIKKVGTSTPVADFKVLAEQIIASSTTSSSSVENDFEELCLQIQVLIKEFFNESLVQLSFDDEMNGNMTVYSFQEKAFECIKIHREYAIKLKMIDSFNLFLKTFKVYLLNESNNKKYSSHIESFWRKFFVESSVSFITSNECGSSSVNLEEAQAFLSEFMSAKENVEVKKESSEKDNEEDLLDLM
jgi:ATP-dependent DNA helicase 2 subunit 2